MFTIRFWNSANENICVGGKYSHDFFSLEDAWDGAYALVESAYKLGAVAMDINNEFWNILDD